MTDRPYLNLLINKDDIDVRVRNLAAQIAQDLKGRPTLLVGLLKGSVVFLSDLIRGLSANGLEPELDFMMTTSYGESTEPSETVEITLDIRSPLKGKTVLLVEDIVDTGGTLAEVVKRVESKSPDRILTCALLDKPSRRKFDVKPDYVGFEIEDVFVVGYGLDAGGKYRGLPYIASISE